MSAAIKEISLADRLRHRIAAEGPIRVSEYMDACNADARDGYYMSRQPIGAEGDFITAPEVSQIFGELLGLWCVAVWQSMEAPSSVTVAEFGPGRGTLLTDAIRAWGASADFLRSVSTALVETSPTLRQRQAAALANVPMPLQWHASVAKIPDAPLIVLANEFIDALPVRQLVRRGENWHERRIALDGYGDFIFVEGEEVAAGHLPPLPAPAADGEILETRPAVATLLAELSARAARAPLAALFVDYGHAESACGETLQAVQRHRYADPLASPGEADLSAHVDFAALKREAQAHGLIAYGPLPQGEFLLKLGLGARRDRLRQGATADQMVAVSSGAARLVDPRQMGIVFKVLALTSSALPPPPPF